MPDGHEDIRRKSFMTTVELGCVCLNISSVAAQNWDVTWVYRLQVYLNEDEDDVTRKNLEDMEVVISPIGRSRGL